MDAAERKSLAEQILSNPLFSVVLDEIEAAAIEALIGAKDEQSRVEAQWRVRAARSFRSDCEAALRSNPTRKGAPA